LQHHQNNHGVAATLAVQDPGQLARLDCTRRSYMHEQVSHCRRMLGELPWTAREG